MYFLVLSYYGIQNFGIIYTKFWCITIWIQQWSYYILQSNSFCICIGWISTLDFISIFSLWPIVNSNNKRSIQWFRISSQFQSLVSSIIWFFHNLTLKSLEIFVYLGCTQVLRIMLSLIYYHQYMLMNKLWKIMWTWNCHLILGT